MLSSSHRFCFREFYISPVSVSIVRCLTDDYLLLYRLVLFFAHMAIRGTLSFTFPAEKSSVGRRS